MATHRSRAGLFGGVIVVIIVIAIMFFFTKEKKGDTPVINSTSTPPTLEQKMVVTSKTIKEDNKTAGYVVNVTYPQVSGLSHSDAEIKINKSIAAKVNLLVNDFKKSNNDVRDPLPGAGPSTVDVSYNVQSNNTIPNLVSIKLVESFFESGAAHPGHYIDTLNYNTSTGAEISLGDVFSNGAAYLNRLSEYTRVELQKKIGDNENLYPQITSGTEPVEENFATFIFADTGLLVVFQEYQVAAYAAGVQEILVPYSELKDILDQNGPLAFIFNR